jgi:hypothetical protein
MPSLEEAIADAATELTKETDKSKETKPRKTLAPEIGTDDTEEEQTQEHESDDEGQESDASQEDELDDASKDEALRLYKALKDPKAGPAVLAALAQQAGLLGKNTPETKTEVATAKKQVKEILKDSLPENMKFLADQLGPAIEAVFEQEREEQNEKFQQIEIQRVENQVIEAYKRLARDTKGDSVKLEARMAEISKKISPAPDVSVNEYIDYLYQIASGGKGTQVSSSRQVADRIRRNANDLPSRLRTTTGSSDDKDWIPKKAIGLKGAVNLALEQLAKQRK